MDRRKLERLADYRLIIQEAFALGLMFDLVGILHGRLGASPLKHELKSPDSADARSSWNVIDGVAHQAQQVDDLRRWDAEFLLDPRLVTPFNWRHRHLAFHIRRVL